MKDFLNYWRALTYAVDKYKTLNRKNGTPYIVHPIRITSILRAVGFSEFVQEDIMIAALLHDLLEDTNITVEEIRNQFGKKIASIVKELTKPEQGNKEEWLRSLENVSKEARIIKMADRIDNLMDMNTSIWSNEKQKSYVEQGRIVLEKCGSANSDLAFKLKETIKKILRNL